MMHQIMPVSGKNRCILLSVSDKNSEIIENSWRRTSYMSCVIKSGHNHDRYAPDQPYLKMSYFAHYTTFHSLLRRCIRIMNFMYRLYFTDSKVCFS